VDPAPLHHRIGQSLLFLVVGVMLIALPIVTWKNSVCFALLYSPGLLLGPFLILLGTRALLRGDESSTGG
jgi:hypothetical protein